MAKRLVTKDQRNDMLDAAATAVFVKLSTIGKREQKKVAAGVIVVVKWKDSMPTTEMVLDVLDPDSDECVFKMNTSLQLFNLQSRHIHSCATCDQIVAVLGKLL